MAYSTTTTKVNAFTGMGRAGRPPEHKPWSKEKLNSKPDLDPEKEWERVREAWGDDKEAWMRYSGYKLTEEVA